MQKDKSKKNIIEKLISDIKKILDEHKDCEFKYFKCNEAFANIYFDYKKVYFLTIHINKDFNIKCDQKVIIKEKSINEKLEMISKKYKYKLSTYSFKKLKGFSKNGKESLWEQKK